MLWLKDFARSELFKSEIIIESLKIAFGSMEVIRDAKYYGYSNEDHNDEREIPPYMVAFAATAVSFILFYSYSSFTHFWLQDYAILQNLIYDTNTTRAIEFSTPVFEDIFRGHMVRLLEWRNKKPAVYRRFMHRQFKDIM